MRSRQSLSVRQLGLLRCLGLCGPLYFKQVLRALPAFAEDLLNRRTRDRLLYRELARLVRLKFLDSKRPVGSTAAVYFLTERGSAALEAQGVEAPSIASVEGYLRQPLHEEIVHGILVEFVVARKAETALLEGIAWSLSEVYPVPSSDGVSRTYVPDLVLWLTLRGGTVYSVLIEVDRGTESHATWKSKLSKAGAQLAAQGRTSRLLVVAESASRLKSLRETSARVLPLALLQQTRWALARSLVAETLFDRSFEGTDGTRVGLGYLVNWSRASNKPRPKRTDG